MKIKLFQIKTQRNFCGKTCFAEIIFLQFIIMYHLNTKVIFDIICHLYKQYIFLLVQHDKFNTVVGVKI